MKQNIFEPEHKNMGSHMISGIVNSGVVQIVKVSCQFISVIVLSRLLPPADFGLVAMVGPLMGFIALFQELGLSQATIQKPSLSHDEVNAFFWINVGAGAFLTLLVVALSPLVGWYYDEPRVVPLTAAMGVLILIGSFGNQPNAILTRRMEFGILSINGALGAIGGLVVSIIAATLLKEYWALYWGLAAGTIIPVVGVWMASRWRPTAPRRIEGLREMLKFGTNVTSSNVFHFLAGNMDNVLIGWKWGGNALGLYDRAYRLLLFPVQRIVDPIIITMVPVLSRLNTDPDKYRSVFLRTLAQITLLTWPGIVWALVQADTLVPTLLGHQWISAVPLYRFLAIAGFAHVINGSVGCLLISQGRTRELARWSIIHAVTCLIAFALGLPYGAVGVAAAYSLSECLRTPFLWWYVTRKGPIKLPSILYAILPQIISVIMSAVFLLLYRKFVASTTIAELVGGLVLSYFTAVLSMSASGSGREVLKQSGAASLRIIKHLLLKVRRQTT